MENKKNIKEIKEIKNLESLNKESRIFLFLNEIKESKNLNSNIVKDLYLNKYKLNEKSNSINIRVIERFIGVYSKYSNEKKIERVKELNNNLVNLKINYKDLVESYNKVKELSKRSNRISLNINLKDLEI